jgi:hypothetical protein
MLSKRSIENEIRQLRKKIENSPGIWKFRGRRVIPEQDWKWGDWTKLPGEYIVFLIGNENVPVDWQLAYSALMKKLQDPDYGRARRGYCAINQAQRQRAGIEKRKARWEAEGGEEGRQRFYETCSPQLRSQFLREDGMREAELRVYSELAGAANRTCTITNYFNCPYGEEWKQLLSDGHAANKLWEHVEWYDRHWNRGHSFRHTESERKWYHYGEPPIIDVSNFEDIRKALDDGRLDKIATEHERYMKETGCESWNI